MKTPTKATDLLAPRVVVDAPVEGYMGSSLDLRAGLVMREIRVSALPTEIVSELARMRRLWPAVAVKPVLSGVTLAAEQV